MKRKRHNSSLYLMSITLFYHSCWATSTDCDSWHPVLFPFWEHKDLTLHLLTHSLTLSGRRYLSDDRRATSKWLLMHHISPFSHTTWSAINLTQTTNCMINTPILCLPSLSILLNRHMEYSHWYSLTFDQHYIWTTGCDTLITIIT